MEKKAGKTGGLSRVFAIDGTDLSEFGFSKLEAYQRHLLLGITVIIIGSLLVLVVTIIVVGLHT